MPKRVLIVSPSGVAGGAERCLLGPARYLPEDGILPVFVTLQDGPLCGWLRDLGREVHVLQTGRTRNLPSTALTLRRLAELGRSVDASVFFSNQAKGHVFGGLAARLARRPAVWWQLGIPDRSRLQRIAARVPAAMVFCGSDAARAAQEGLNARSRTVTVNPGVDLESILSAKGSGRAIRERLGWDANRIVGVVARLEPGKGQDVFIRAMAQIAPSHPDTRFLVVGGAILGWEGDYPARLSQLASELGLDDRMAFVGHQDDVFPWFDACDVVVNPSFGEGFGLVVVEAMALGKPLVSTNAGGPREIVEDGVSGLLVHSHDAEAIAGAVTSILDDAAVGARLGKGAARRAAEYSEQRSAERLAVVLRRLSERPRASI
jgi:glycosyltransferase involved in cell wall biosynthesis